MLHNHPCVVFRVSSSLAAIVLIARMGTGGGGGNIRGDSGMAVCGARQAQKKVAGPRHGATPWRFANITRSGRTLSARTLTAPHTKLRTQEPLSPLGLPQRALTFF